ncbi:MAG: ABC transporter ATP-binding protein [Pseudomonadota bacterium]
MSEAASTGRESLTSGIRALLPFAQGARASFALAALIAAAAAFLGLVPYWVINEAIGIALTPELSQESLWLLAGFALAAVVGRFACEGIATFIAHRGAFQIQYDVRLALARHLAALPLGKVTRRRSGELKKVMADDVERLELFLAHAIPDTVAAVLTVVALATWMVLIDWRLALATYILIVPAFACIALGMRRAGMHMTEYRETQAQMNASIVELLRGMAVVKMFNRDADEVRGTESTIARYIEVVRGYSLDFLPYGTGFYVLLGANAAILIPLAGWLWHTNSISTQTVLFFLIVGLGALATVNALLYLFANLSHIASGGAIVRDVLAEPALESSNAVAEHGIEPRVEFDGVWFRYENAWVLEDVSFSAAPSELTALVGPSGGGKSTVAALIGRFFDPERGEIRIGGHPLARLGNDTLNRQVSMVLQETFLFDDSIAGNLRVARADATDAELVRACEQACIHDTIAALSDGYATVVGERGVRLSGGERQRLTIARAILADAPIVVLDEATAFVDPENEHAIQQAISELVRGRTVIMVAHRLSTVRGADQILVLDQGSIVERGDHDELVARNGLYAQLWQDFNVARATGLRAERP